MKIRAIVVAGALAVAALVPAAAEAASLGVARTNVNMRAGPGVSYLRIAVVPAGATFHVFNCWRWCRVGFAGHVGWVSASYVATGYPRPSRFVVRRAWGPYYGDPFWYGRPDWSWRRSGWNIWFGF